MKSYLSQHIFLSLPSTFSFLIQNILLLAYFFLKESEGEVNLGERIKDFGKVGGRETAVRMYCMREELKILMDIFYFCKSISALSTLCLELWMRNNIITM